MFAETQVVGRAATLTGSVAGGLVARWTNLGVPYLLRRLALVVTFVVAFVYMQDWGFVPKPGKHPVREMGQVVRASVHYGLGNPPVRWVMLAAAPFTFGVGIFAFYTMQPYLLELYGDEQAYSIAGLAAAITAGAQIAGGMVAPQVRRLFRNRTSVLLAGLLVEIVLLVLLGIYELLGRGRGAGAVGAGRRRRLPDPAGGREQPSPPRPSGRRCCRSTTCSGSSSGVVIGLLWARWPTSGATPPPTSSRPGSRRWPRRSWSWPGVSGPAPTRSSRAGPARDLTNRPVGSVVECTQSWRTPMTLAPTATDRGTETRRRILEVAAEAFARRGYAGTSLNDVLKASRVTRVASTSTSRPRRRWPWPPSAEAGEVDGRGDGAVLRHPEPSTSSTPWSRPSATCTSRTRSCQAISRLSAELGDAHPELRPQLRHPAHRLDGHGRGGRPPGQDEGDIRPEVDPAVAAEVAVEAFIGLETVSEVLTGQADLRRRARTSRPCSSAAIRQPTT